MTREDWLNGALAIIRQRLAAVGCTVPADARVSVGFAGGGKANKALGQCWTRAMSSIGVNEMFISPVITSPADMVGVLIHEAIHAADDCASGHKGAFKRAAVAVGLVGKMTATTLGQALKEWIDSDIIAVLPVLEHGSLRAGTGKPKQSTRMLKFECGACGCIVRASDKWVPTMEHAQCGCGNSGFALIN